MAITGANPKVVTQMLMTRSTWHPSLRRKYSGSHTLVDGTGPVVLAELYWEAEQ